MRMIAQVLCLAAALLPFAASAADAPQEADWTAPSFTFHTGQTLPNLRLHYVTLGAPTGEPVLILHGTAGTGAGMLAPAFAAALFAPGAPLDSATHFIILPDSIGAGASAKPSDGLHAKFPEYDYADMVLAQYRLLTEGLGIHHLRIIIGNSMGGMETWTWGEQYPGFMDALVPMASQPTPMAARNWMLRSLLIESIRQDPAYRAGDYTSQPPSLRLANAMFGVATNGGTLGWQTRATTHAQADQLVADTLAAPAPRDANDYIYQWAASADYDPTPGLGRIEAPVLAINSADDERNPPDTGVTVQALKQVKDARLYLIPASAETRGHGTTGLSHFWAPALKDFLAALPHRGT